VFVDVVDDLVGDVVADALTPLAEEPDLGGRDVVLDELRDHADVLPPLLELYERIVCSMLVVVECYIGRNVPISVPLRSRIKAP